MGGRNRGGSRGSRQCANGSFGCNGNRCMWCGDQKRAARRTDTPEPGEVKARYGETNTGGHTDIYFGGKGAPDGPGHGHVRVDEQGDETIVREAYSPGEPGARRDATLLDGRTPDRRR